MAQIAQGTKIRRASSVTLSHDTTAGLQIATAVGQKTDTIKSTHATADFVTLGITTVMRLLIDSTKNPQVVTPHTVAATVMTIYEDWSTSINSTAFILTAYNMTTLGDIVGWSGPNESAPVIDITNLQSSVKEKMIAYRDSGEVTLDVLFNQEGTQLQRLRLDLQNRKENYYDIVINDSASLGSYFFFKAYPTAFSIQGAVDQVIKGSITLAITGAVDQASRL